MSENYQNDPYANDPALQQLLSQSRDMDIQFFSSVAAQEMGEVDPYNTNPEEEQTVEQIFSEFGAPQDTPPIIPAWMQQHDQQVQDLHFKQQQSQNLSTPGLTNLSSPAYHLEKLDHKHRMGDVLQALYCNWAYTPSTSEGFFEWLDSLSYFQVYALLKNLKGDVFARDNTPAFMRGVEYLDQLSRRHYQVIISKRHSCLTWNGRPLDTKGLSTVFSGKGWGAWVLSSTDKFYTGPHIRGEFHHSSFLSGGLVKAAGEWKVQAGRIKYINGKTGHYKCPIDKLVEALKLIQSQFGLGGANVIVWDPHTKKPTEFPAIAFVSNPVMQEEYNAFGQGTLHTPERETPRMQIGGHRIQH